MILSGCGGLPCRCPEPIGLSRPTGDIPLSFRTGPNGGDVVETDCYYSPSIPFPSSSSSSSSSSGLQIPFWPFPQGFLIPGPFAPGVFPPGPGPYLTAAYVPQTAVNPDQTETVLIDVPHPESGEIISVEVRVRNGFHVFRGPGWMVTLVKRTAAIPEPSIVPATTPASQPSLTAVLATVVLPEFGNPYQYWVPVLTDLPGAALHARQWTVVFNKVPLTASQSAAASQGQPKK